MKFHCTSHTLPPHALIITAFDTFTHRHDNCRHVQAAATAITAYGAYFRRRFRQTPSSAMPPFYRLISALSAICLPLMATLRWQLPLPNVSCQLRHCRIIGLLPNIEANTVIVLSLRHFRQRQYVQYAAVLAISHVIS